MSTFNLAKKLIPAKKAWKSFTKKLQSKLHKLNNSISAKKTTRGLKPLRSNIHRLLTPRSRSPIRHLSPLDYRCHHCHYSGHDYLHMNVAPIYVDDLFERDVINSPSHAKKIYQCEGRSRSAKEMGATCSGRGENKAEGKRVFSLPEWRGIDERAEEFISKFREDMKLQREKSIDDFHQMLARSC